MAQDSVELMAPTREKDARIGQRALVVIAAMLVVVVTFGSLWTAHRMQDDLTRRARAALDAAGLDVAVQVDGRDATLSGAAPLGQAERAVAVVAHVEGMRRVNPGGLEALRRTVPNASAPTSVPTSIPGPGSTSKGPRTSGGTATDGNSATIPESTGSSRTSGASGISAATPARSTRTGRSAAAAPSTGPSQRSSTGSVTGPTAGSGARADRVLGRVSFDVDSADLSGAARAFLDTVAATLAADPRARVRLDGYTDGMGAAGVNLALSRRRAAAVAGYLVSRGIPGRRLVVAGPGAAQPVASDATAAGRSANRRVEVLIEEAG
jgi:outer membrane protein OmpA-like peptidoglycan-associated protein